MTGQSVILLRYGEIHLKGRNRPFFERCLKKSIRKTLEGTGAAMEYGQGRYYVLGYDPAQERGIVERLKRVFGLYSVSLARRTSKDWQQICLAARELMTAEVAARGGKATFKVESRRADKHYPMRSMEMNRVLGGLILDQVPGTTVDVHHPEVPLGVEIREEAYIYAGEERGAGGLPLGCNGRATLLLSGGIDSPVAGHMMLKRGLKVDGVYFHSPPYTSERAKEKVVTLAQTLARYSGNMQLYVVPFTKMQLAIYEVCPPAHCTIILRRAMMQVAEQIALKTHSGALITGEALGQVASQTLESLAATNDAVALPVFRPVIGFDKSEIVERARAIDTYETSILPFEDCCTIFTPKNPVIHPKLEDMQRSQALVKDWDALLQEAVEGAERIAALPRP